MGELGALDIQRWMKDLRDEGLSANTVRCYLSVLKMALSQAVAWRLIPYNPGSTVRPPSSHAKPRVVWDEAQLELFLSYTRDHPQHALWRLLAKTGMRVGEALALTTEDLDLARGVVWINRTMTRDDAGRIMVGITTKTQRSRRPVVLDEETIVVLQDVVRQGGVLFPWSRVYVTRRLRAVLNDLGWPDATPHFFRHMHESYLMRAGVQQPVAMARLGHASARMLTHYSHPDVTDQRRAVEALRAVLSRPSSGRQQVLEGEVEDRQSREAQAGELTVVGAGGRIAG